MSFHSILKETRIRHLNLPPPHEAQPSERMESLLPELYHEHCECCLVTESGHLLGIITVRDILNKVIGVHTTLNQRACDIMTPDPTILTCDATIDEAVRAMSEGGYRHIPVVDQSGTPVAVLSARNIMQFIAECFPDDIGNLPPHLRQTLSDAEGA